MVEMSKDILKQLCKQNGLYTTPHINDKLYLHYKGFNSIASLEEYTGLKAIWLEGNGLAKIEGLDKQILLRTLYLHENLIEKIENINHLVELDNVNLAKNYITRIENITELTKLTSLNLANNQLSSYSDVEDLLHCPSLQTLDVQHNKLNDPNILDIFDKLPDLRVLYLMGNPVVKEIRNYRKTIISRCKHLTYLDDRPVFEDERRRVNAWAAAMETSGGNLEAANAAEREELAAIRKEKDDHDERNYLAFQKIVDEGKEIRRKREEEERIANGLPPLPPAPPAAATTVILESTALPPAPPSAEQENNSSSNILNNAAVDGVSDEKVWKKIVIESEEEAEGRAPADLTSLD